MVSDESNHIFIDEDQEVVLNSRRLRSINSQIDIDFQEIE